MKKRISFIVSMALMLGLWGVCDIHAEEDPIEDLTVMDESSELSDSVSASAFLDTDAWGVVFCNLVYGDAASADLTGKMEFTMEVSEDGSAKLRTLEGVEAKDLSETLSKKKSEREQALSQLTALQAQTTLATGSVADYLVPGASGNLLDFMPAEDPDRYGLFSSLVAAGADEDILYDMIERGGVEIAARDSDGNYITDESGNVQTAVYPIYYSVSYADEGTQGADR